MTALVVRASALWDLLLTESGATGKMPPLMEDNPLATHLDRASPDRHSLRRRACDHRPIRPRGTRESAGCWLLQGGESPCRAA